MIKIENVDVFGWQTTIRGMRNAFNSWDKSDTAYKFLFDESQNNKGYIVGEPSIGENDLKLMKQLSKAGNDHGKFLRMINVSFDLTAPLEFWKQFDTYKVGTVCNSCSTMHTIHKKQFELSDFSYDELDEYYLTGLKNIITVLNIARDNFLSTNDKKHWIGMIKLLPSCYNQKRTIVLNYQVLKNQYFARRNHKLGDWHTYCDWCLTLPYFKEICVDVIDK